MLFLVIQKDGREGFAGIQLRLKLPSDSDTELPVPFDDDSTEEEDADCLFCTGRFSEDHKGEEWIGCAKYFRRAYTLYAGMKEGFICEPCQE